MLGAHLDSVREGPGINDNGSGVASTLALAERLRGRRGAALRISGRRTARPLRLARLRGIAQRGRACAASRATSTSTWSALSNAVPYVYGQGRGGAALERALAPLASSRSTRSRSAALKPLIVCRRPGSRPPASTRARTSARPRASGSARTAAARASSLDACYHRPLRHARPRRPEGAGRARRRRRPGGRGDRVGRASGLPFVGDPLVCRESKR